MVEVDGGVRDGGLERCVKLFAVFQPGGHQERTQLLREISDEKSSSTASVADLTNRRRNAMRSGEIRVQRADLMVMMGVLAKWAD